MLIINKLYWWFLNYFQNCRSNGSIIYLNTLIPIQRNNVIALKLIWHTNVEPDMWLHMTCIVSLSHLLRYTSPLTPPFLILIQSQMNHNGRFPAVSYIVATPTSPNMCHGEASPFPTLMLPLFGPPMWGREREIG